MHVGNRDDGSTYYMEGSAKGIYVLNIR